MEIIQSTNGDIENLAVKGRLDAVSANEAENKFTEILESGKNMLLIDLSELEYISSAGLRVLLVLAKQVQQKGGKVALAGLNESVKEIFEISGFSSIFKIFEPAEDIKEFFAS